MTPGGQDQGAPGSPWLMTQEQLDGVVAADRRRSRIAGSLLSFAFVAAAVVLIAVAVVIDRQVHGVPAVSALELAAFCLLAAIIAPAVVIALHRSRSRHWRQRQRECLEFASVVEEIQDRTLGKLISFNFRLMDRFIAVALSQARASFLACCLAAFAALLVLLVGTAMVLAAGSTGAQVTAGVLSTAGVALSGFLSVTFLRTFQMTSRQMSYYYGQPLVHCYLLHAEWLAERFEKDGDPAAVWQVRQELIRAALGAGHNAQNHLLDLQRPVPASRTARDLASAAMYNGRSHRAPRDGAEMLTLP
jgi:hypothetical protein